jgi:hypothetical protein
MDVSLIYALSEIKTQGLWRSESNFRDKRPETFKSHETKTVPGKPGRKESISYDHTNLAILLLHLHPNVGRDVRAAAHSITTFGNLERKLKVQFLSLTEEELSI